MDKKKNELDKALDSVMEMMKKEGLSFVGFELKCFKPKDGEVMVKDLKITNKNGMSERI